MNIQVHAPQIGNSIIVARWGEIVGARSTSGDEPSVVRCHLDLTLSHKSTTPSPAPEQQAYGLMVERKGVVPLPG